MAAADKIRIGVVGVGKMGRYHLEKYLQLPGVAVVGFVEPRAQIAAELTAKYGVRAFTELAELLFEVDALTVACPTDAHAWVARRALEAGVHVLIEKPIASRIEDAEELVALAKRKACILQVGMVERFRLGALAQGVPLRPALFVEAHRLSAQLARESTIDVVSDLMIHDLDLALSLIDEDPSQVSAIGMKVVTDKDDLANVRIEFPSGAVMNLNASRVSQDPVRKLRVFSDSAYVSFDFHKNTATVLRRNEKNAVEKNVQQKAGFDPLLEQARDFVECVRTGRRPLVSGEDGVRALRIAQLVIQRIEERGRLQASVSSHSTELNP